MGPSGSLRVAGGMPSKGTARPRPFLSLSHFLPEVRGSAVPRAHHDVLPRHRSKATGPSDHGLDRLKPGAKINLSLYELINLGICCSDEKLTLVLSPLSF